MIPNLFKYKRNKVEYVTSEISKYFLHLMTNNLQQVKGTQHINKQFKLNISANTPTHTKFMHLHSSNKIVIQKTFKCWMKQVIWMDWWKAMMNVMNKCPVMMNESCECLLHKNNECYDSWVFMTGLWYRNAPVSKWL